MSAYLYLPTNTKPPYQSVVYFPGAVQYGILFFFDPANGSELPWVDFVLKSGRAFIYPILKGTHERNHGLKNTNSEKQRKIPGICVHQGPPTTPNGRMSDVVLVIFLPWQISIYCL